MLSWSSLFSATKPILTEINAIFIWKLQPSIYTQKKKFSQYLCLLIISTILHISLSNFIHELYYRNFTCTCLFRDK